MFYRKTFNSVDNLDIEDMGAVVGQMRNLLQAFNSGILPEKRFSLEAILPYLTSLVKGQGVNGAWSATCKVDQLNEEEEFEFVRFTTALGIALFSEFSRQLPEARILKLSENTQALEKACSYLAEKGLQGPGFDPLYQAMEIIYIFEEGHVFETLGQEPFFTSLEKELDSLTGILNQRIERKEWKNPFGIEMEERYKQVAALLNHRK